MARTNLDDYARRARRRLTLAAIVGAIFFASGVGLVAALAPGNASTDAVTDDVAAVPVATADAPGEPTDGSPTDIGKPDPTAVRAVPAVPAVPAAPAAAAEPAEDAGDKAEAADAPAGDKWWSDLSGKRCKVMYGDHDRLVVREGTLRRDETTTYGPFVDNAVVARVRRENATEVTVHHIGIHPRNGRPSLASVTVHEASGDIEGILPLQIGGDQIELRPVGGAQ